MRMGLRHVRAFVGNSLPAPGEHSFCPGGLRGPHGYTLEVYVKGQEASNPDVLSALNRELTALMQTAGFRVSWRGAGNPPSALVRTV